MDLFVRERKCEPIAEREQGVVLQLLLLVRAHPALAPVAHAVALLGLGEDYGRLALVRDRGAVGGIDLERVMPAAVQPVDVVVRQMRDQGLQLGVLVEEVLAVEAAVRGGVLLELAVHRFVQALHDHALGVAGEQRVPVGAP